MSRLFALGLVLAFVACRGEPELAEFQQAATESEAVTALRAEVAALHDSIGVLLERPVQVVVRQPEYGCEAWSQDATYWLCTYPALSSRWTSDDFRRLQMATAVP